MDWALCVAVLAVFVSIRSAISSSKRNEAHHQVTIIQGLINELGELTHRYMREMHDGDSMPTSTRNTISRSFEVLCSLKCDQLESTFVLLIRRCSSRLLFDANSKVFKVRFIRLVGNLRVQLSAMAEATVVEPDQLYATHAALQNLYSELNSYIGERFRPVCESLNI